MDQYDFTAPFEGIFNHMYLDKKGLVTAGVGFMLPDVAAAQLLPWDAPGAVYSDYNLIRQQEAGHGAAYYRKYTSARLPESVMREEFARRMTAFELVLIKRIPDWRQLPMTVRMALKDMAYNMGAGFYNKKDWPKFVAAVGARDWVTAARECKRGDVQESRNQATMKLFLEALA